MPIKAGLPENATDESHVFGNMEVDPTTGKRVQEQITWLKATDDHKFLEKRVLYQDEGITYKLFNKSEEAYITPEKDSKPAHLLIPEVVAQNDIKFFKVPRLGSYLAVKLQYKSCLFEGALDRAMVDQDKYQKLVDEVEGEREDWEKAQTDAREAAKAANERFEYEPWPEKPMPKRPPFITQDERFVVCLDTLG
jgi:hypothetical protein